MFVFSFFFFKQKTAYEMRISDWSSDVCSSDLVAGAGGGVDGGGDGVEARLRGLPLGQARAGDLEGADLGDGGADHAGEGGVAAPQEIGRASCRERVCQYV